jgi:inosine-uridine nucleoside N-ribohydrolase
VSFDHFVDSYQAFSSDFASHSAPPYRDLRITFTIAEVCCEYCNNGEDVVIPTTLALTPAPLPAEEGGDRIRRLEAREKENRDRLRVMLTKILLDTDIGSDIDDAVCLAYLLANPQCELLGITTVTGEVERRAQMASALCKVAGKDVPIFPGREDPLLVPQRQPKAPQAAALDRWAHDEGFPKGQAVEFMRQTIRTHPGEVILLTIGPLTNIAALFAADEEIPRLLKGLVSMCGVFTNRLSGVGPQEWNATCDPHATSIVYHASPKIHRSIGLDVTCQVTMPAAQVRQRFQAPLLRPVLDFAEVWFQTVERITFHDPLAATTIFDETICQFERGHIDVELHSGRLAGMTHWTADPEGSKEVALGVKSERFFDHYFSFFGS